MNVITTNLIITSIRSKTDRSLSLSATTPELSSEQKVEFMNLQGINLQAYLKPLEIVPDGITQVEANVKQKTPSQRLRSCLLALYTQEKPEETFDEFYNSYMEKIITHVKDKLTS